MQQNKTKSERLCCEQPRLSRWDSSKSNKSNKHLPLCIRSQGAEGHKRPLFSWSTHSRDCPRMSSAWADIECVGSQPPAAAFPRVYLPPLRSGPSHAGPHLGTKRGGSTGPGILVWSKTILTDKTCARAPDRLVEALWGLLGDSASLPENPFTSDDSW